ncbi:MAG: PQQ-dependent sugar dehydrogenase [Planctomycetales bacterium]|nr:PQQ-dependent sugar dehydrogenase [Planctomycetales bacterium]
MSVAFRNAAGEPVDQVAVGEVFHMDLLAQDLRTDTGPSGVSSAYAGLQYNTQLLDVLRIEHAWDALLLGQIDEPAGRIHNAGGVEATAPANRDPQRVLTFEAVAAALGTLEIATEPADSIFAENTLFGVDGDLTDATTFGSATLEIVAPADPAWTVVAVESGTNEGSTGIRNVQFEISLTEPVASPVTVEYATADGSAHGLRVRQIASGLNTPLFAASPPGDANRLFIVEKGGAIKVLHLDTLSVEPTPFLQLSNLSTVSETGLLGLAFDPDFLDNGYFYVNYNTATAPAGFVTETRVARFQVSGDPAISNVADPESETPVLSFGQPFANHNGGWLGFGPDGYLYIAAGDGGSSNDPQGHGQNLSSLLGAMLRIDPAHDAMPADPDANYAIPADNPFANDGDANTRGEIWSYGLRNPWRPSFDRLTGDLYIADVGQNAREEINLQSAGGPGGENYGWRLREGTIATPAGGGARPAGAIDPIYDYAHGSGATQGNSVTGGYAYRGPLADLAGAYFFADFVNNRIWSLHQDGAAATNHDGANFIEFHDWTDRIAAAAGPIRSITSFAEDNAGNLYILSAAGTIHRLEGGADYGHATGLLTFEPGGPLTQTVSIDVFGDGLFEYDESFYLTLSNGSGVPIPVGRASSLIANDDVAPATLFVTKVIAEPRGVVVEFSRALAAEALNLYGTPAPGDKQIDLHLFRPNGTPVRGSLFVEAGGTQIRFVPTAGQLPVGEYELILESRADAFAAADDDLLDGNRDGIAGDHFRTVFSIESPADRLVSLRHVAAAPGDVIDIATSEGIPLHLNHGESVTGLQFELHYNSKYFAEPNVRLLDAIPLDWVPVIDTATPGVLRFSANGAALESGPADLLAIEASVLDTATYGAAQVLQLAEVVLSGTEDSIGWTDSVHVVARPGDATGNSEYSAQDASLVARNAVGLDNGFDFFPRIDPTIVADMTENGVISALDAAIVARAAVGLAESTFDGTPVVAYAREAAGAKLVSLADTIDALAIALLTDSRKDKQAVASQF